MEKGRPMVPIKNMEKNINISFINPRILDIIKFILKKPKTILILSYINFKLLKTIKEMMKFCINYRFYILIHFISF